MKSKSSRTPEEELEDAGRVLDLAFLMGGAANRTIRTTSSKQRPLPSTPSELSEHFLRAATAVMLLLPPGFLTETNKRGLWSHKWRGWRAGLVALISCSHLCHFFKSLPCVDTTAVLPAQRRVLVPTSHLRLQEPPPGRWRCP